MIVALIAKPGGSDSGVGHYVTELGLALQRVGHHVIFVHPFVPFPRWFVRVIRKWAGWDLEAFFQNYPVWARYPQADIYHITSQNLASLMLFRPPPGRTVLTVHDVLPYTNRDDPALSSYNHVVDRWMDALAIRGVRHVGVLLAVSEYTRRCLVEQLGIAPECIVVTLEGVTTPMQTPRDARVIEDKVG